MNRTTSFADAAIVLGAFLLLNVVGFFLGHVSRAVDLAIYVGGFLLLGLALLFLRRERPRRAEATAILAQMAMLAFALGAGRSSTLPEMRRPLAVLSGLPYPLWGAILALRASATGPRPLAIRLILPGIAMWGLLSVWNRDVLLAGLAVGSGFATAFFWLMAKLEGTKGKSTRASQSARASQRADAAP